MLKAIADLRCLATTLIEMHTEYYLLSQSGHKLPVEQEQC